MLVLGGIMVLALFKSCAPPEKNGHGHSFSWQVWICVVQENGRTQATKSSLEGIVSQSANYLRYSDPILPIWLGDLRRIQARLFMWGWLFICCCNGHGLWRGAFVEYHLEVEIRPVFSGINLHGVSTWRATQICSPMDGWVEIFKCGAWQHERDDMVLSHVFYMRGT